MEIKMSPIGFIETPFKTPQDLRVPPFKREAPYRDPEVHGILHINQEFLEGISDIQPLSYGMVVFYFDRSNGYDLTTYSAHMDKPLGVFSTRSPRRPNGIGVSIVRFLSVDGNRIAFRGVDMLDGTPILDIKPYTGENLPDC